MRYRRIPYLPISTCVVLLTVLLRPSDAHNGAVAIAVPVEGIVVDGDLSDWPEEMARYPIARQEGGDPMASPEDFKGEFRIGFNVQDNALYVAVEVEDDSIVRKNLERELWDVDGCKIYIELTNEGETTTPLQLVLWGDNRYAWKGGPDPLEEAQVEARWSDRAYQFEWRIDVGSIGNADFSLKDFHDRLLSAGSIALPLVIRHVFGDSMWTAVKGMVFSDVVGETA